MVENLLKSLGLNTVCVEANCPNYCECFSRKTATFMIMGTNCTRNCRFCNVRYADPQLPDPQEPEKIAKAIKTLELKYAVITSVTRDDLPDGGAGHFKKVISEVRQASPETAIEVLIPDLGGKIDSLKLITDAAPTVISHNLETVKSLYSCVRPDAEYTRSLKLLENIKLLNEKIYSKSGIMVGLGETTKQVYELFEDLLKVGCDFLTIGQYLAPSKEHIPVKEYIEPAQFEEFAATAKQMGFGFIASAPFVRSSYNAAEAIDELVLR